MKTRRQIENDYIAEAGVDSSDAVAVAQLFISDWQYPSTQEEQLRCAVVVEQDRVNQQRSKAGSEKGKKFADKVKGILCDIESREGPVPQRERTRRVFDVMHGRGERFSGRKESRLRKISNALKKSR